MDRAKISVHILLPLPFIRLTFFDRLIPKEIIFLDKRSSMVAHPANNPTHDIYW
jgi:hypothetical protein